MAELSESNNSFSEKWKELGTTQITKKNNVNLVRQIDSSDCAAASLAMVCQFYGIDLVLSEARSLCGANASGQQICSAAHDLGLTASFHRAKFKSLENSDLPLIAHWQGNHWVVILENKDKEVKIADPAAGIYWLPYSEAAESFSGYTCKISGNGSQKTVGVRSNWLIPCLKPFKNIILPTALFMLMTVAAEMLIPFLIQSLIDERLFEEDATFRWLIFYTGLAGGAVIIGQGLQSLLLSKAALKSEGLLLDALMNRWMSMPDEFFKERSFRELRNRFENVFKVRHFLQETAGVLLFALLEFIAIFAMLEHYGQAVFFALTLTPAFLLTVFSFKLSRNQAGALKFSTENFMSCLDDLTKGIFSIKASQASSFFKGLEEQAKNKMLETIRKNERAIVLCEKGALAIGLSSALFLFYRSGKDYMDGQSTAGTMMAILILSTMALNTLYRVLKHRESFEHGAVIYDYLHDVFDINADNEELVQDHMPASVEWRECVIESEESALDKFSLKIPETSSCFLYGETDLLVRTVKNKVNFKSGELKFATESNTYSSVKGLPAISLIEDCPHIFNLSVYENVAMSDVYDEKKVKWCLRLALSDELESKLTYGLRTKLIESQLSFEKKMRIVLARALYREAPVYLLENLSRFMSPKELLTFGYHIQEHLTDRTVIVVDENLQLSKYCTNIAIVYNGNLKGFDSPVNLLNSVNAYSKRFYLNG